MTAALDTSPIQFAEGTRFGPCMRALPNDQMRRFVVAMLEAPKLDFTACARRAGYSDYGGNLHQAGSRLAHDERILAAIQEEAKARMNSGAIMAVSKLLEMASNDTLPPGVQLRAIEMLLNRSGMHATIETRNTTRVELSDESQIIKRIAGLANQLGLDPKALLGQNVIDAEFRDVTFKEALPMVKGILAPKFIPPTDIPPYQNDDLADLLA